MLSNLGKHSSSQFTQEMESIRSDLLRMGGLVEQQVSDAVESFLQHDSKLAQKVRDVEKEVDSLEKQIDEECARVLALRQPAAIDLRTIIAVSKCVADLERMGDKAAKIAKITIQLADEGHLSIGLVEVRHIGERVCKCCTGPGCFCPFDLDKAVAVAESDDDVDAEYQRHAFAGYFYDGRSALHYQVLKLMSVFRALERIGDHCGNLCEQVVYLVSGRDVRHVSVEQMKAIVDKQGS